jgi:hypothetical protein
MTGIAIQRRPAITRAYVGSGYVPLVFLFCLMSCSRSIYNASSRTPFVLGLAAYLGYVQGSRRWSLWLLMVTTLGNVLTSLQLIRHSWRHQLRVAAGLFLYNLLTIFLQARLARMEQTIALQWIEQLNHTLSWAAFAVAAWLWQRFFASTARQ